VPQTAGVGPRSGRALTAEDVARQLMPGVVTLVCDGSQGASLGSGFVVRPGVIATNFHVVQRMKRGGVIRTSSTPSSSPEWWVSEVLAVDVTADLALLAVPGTERARLPVFPLVRSSSAITIGQRVYALGSPRGLTGTISEGIVSASLRPDGESSYVQITAPISPGSSGGPVVNDRGEVIGVAVGSRTNGQNLNFAVPAAKLAALLAQLPVNRTIRDARAGAPWTASPEVTGALERGLPGEHFGGGGGGPGEVIAMDESGEPPEATPFSSPLTLDVLVADAHARRGTSASIGGLNLLGIGRGCIGDLALEVGEPGSRSAVRGCNRTFYFSIVGERQRRAIESRLRSLTYFEIRITFRIVANPRSAEGAIGEVISVSWIDSLGAVVDTVTMSEKR
jgi:hypothetical protein